MNLMQLEIPAIEVETSRYRLFPDVEAGRRDDGARALVDSMRSLGVLQPLLVHHVGGAAHLVDGFRRAAAAGAAGLNVLPCRVLPEETELVEVLRLLVAGRRREIPGRPAAGVRFAAVALGLGLDRNVLRRALFPALGLEPHQSVLRQVEAAARLPAEVLAFCSDRGFSLRQCTSLARYPEALLKSVFSRREKLSLTASILEELLERINDLLRAGGQAVEDFFADEAVRGVFEGDRPAQERTRQMRALVRRRRFPLLTEANDELERIRDETPLPGGAALEWDRTLERHELQLSFVIRDQGDVAEARAALADDRLRDGILRMLERL